jgi:cysteine desulfurase
MKKKGEQTTSPVFHRVYCDYAATTPVDPRVARAMEPYFGAKFGNAGSLHSFGQEAIAALDSARETVAKAIGADFREVVFTGSATEANNLALRGSIRGLARIASGSTQSGLTRMGIRENQRVIGEHPRPRLIVSAVEHESVLETARDLAASLGEASLASGRERDGVEVVVLPVDARGIVDVKKLQAALNDRTVLVSVTYANNEIGTVEPLAEISEVIRNFREERGKRIEDREKRAEDRGQRKSSAASNFSLSSSPYPLFHTDAVQAFQFLDCDVDRLGVDFLTLSAHKIYGPKGVGALFVRGQRTEDGGIEKLSSFPLSPLSSILTGGGQEFGLRSGTENIPAIVGFARAVELAAAAREREAKRLTVLTARFWTGLKKICPRATVNGMPVGRTRQSGGGCSVGRTALRWRLPNVINVCFDRNAQEFLTALDRAGVAASAGSACAARSAAPSHVLRAIGCSREEQRSSVRFSFGRPTARDDIDTALRVIRELLA